MFIYIWKDYNHGTCSHKWWLGLQPHLQSVANTTCFFELHTHEVMTIHKWHIWLKFCNHICRNPSFGLATKAKGLQGCGPKGSLGVTSGTPGSVGKCEGVNPHTPKATPTLGDGVSVDSQNFRDRFEGSNLNGLCRSLYQWKAFEA
jgi:hypothetical protein